MSTFLEKNKKKSALAALLLFIRTRKTVSALLVLVVLASFLFVSPSNVLVSLPGGTRAAAGLAWIAGKAGVDTSKWGLVGGKRDYGDLVAAFSAAKNGGGKAGWAAFMRGNEDAARVGGSSGSLNFVKGNAKDLEVTVASGAKLPKPGSVEGVLNPDDAKSRAEGEGVALSAEDMQGERQGLVKSAFAGGFGSNSGAGGEAGLSGGAFAAANFFGSGRGATTNKLGDLVRKNTNDVKADAGKGVQIQGAAKGQLSKAKASVINTRTAKGLVGSHTISGQRAFVQLAAGRGRAAISVAPNCTAGSGCPGEFAATNTGAVYDGNSLKGDRTDILTVPEIDGAASTPNLPDTGMADEYVREAERMDADARKCRELDDLYGPQEREHEKEQERLSKQFDAMGCGQGGCSKSKAKRCERMGDQMKAHCRVTMNLRCKHVHECPLTKNNYCSPDECNGSARNKTKQTIVSDGNRITTMDQGEEAPECTYTKNQVIQYREATQNAINEYRARSCEALYGGTTLTDKMKYLNQCSGRESSAVNNCKAYGNAVCQAKKACQGGECTGETDQCVITDLKGMEDFIRK